MKTEKTKLYRKTHRKNLKHFLDTQNDHRTFIIQKYYFLNRQISEIQFLYNSII